MRISLRFKLVLSYLLLICFLALASGLLLFNYFTAEYERQYKVNVFTQGSIVANAVRNNLARPSSMVEEVRELSRQFNLRILIIDLENRVLIDSQSGQANDLTREIIKHGEIVTALQGTSSARIYALPVYGEVMYGAVPIFKDKEVIGAVFLSKSLGEFTNLKNEMVNRILISTGLGSMATIIFSLLFAGYLTRPLNQLTRAARKFAEGNLSYRVSYKSKDEFGQLAETFNKMGDELENQDAVRRRFIADASHEIRTPLSTIKVLVQSLQNSNDINRNKVLEFLYDMELEVDRLSSLVNNLLELTRIESQKEEPIALELVQVDALIKKVYYRLNTVAQEKEIQILLDVEDVKAHSDYNSLYRIVYNLADNSMKYTPPGGNIKIKLKEDNNKAVLIVEDTGIGIAEEDLQKIFDRFYRVDTARTGGQGGFGLGLSLVKELCLRLNIDFFVESQLNKGTKFTLYIKR